MSTAILEVQDVVRRFGGLRAVDEASFHVDDGSITALIGPNGAGKSTLFNVISGFLSAERGTVQFEGRRIDRASPHRIAQRGLVRTFQVPRALTRMSVLDNVLLAATRHPGEQLNGLVLHPGRVRSRERRARERAAELLTLFRLDTHAGEYAGVLSGGQRKLLDFAPLITFFAWMIVILGGLGRAWTVPVGAIVFGVIFAGTRFFDFPPFSLLDSTERAYVRLIVIGLVIIGLMLFRPQGIFGSRKEMVLE